MSFNKTLFRKKAQSLSAVFCQKQKQKQTVQLFSLNTQSNLLGGLIWLKKKSVNGILIRDFFTISCGPASMKTRQPSNPQFAFNFNSKNTRRMKKKNTEPQWQQQQNLPVSHALLCVCWAARRRPLSIQEVI